LVLFHCLGLQCAFSRHAHADPDIPSLIIGASLALEFNVDGAFLRSDFSPGAMPNLHPMFHGCLHRLLTDSGSDFTDHWMSHSTREENLLVGFDRTDRNGTSMILRGQDCGCPTQSVWARGYGAGGQVHASATAPGADYSVGGVQLGLHRDLGDGRVLGVYGSFGRSSVNQSAWRQSGDVDNTLIGVYGGLDDGPLHTLLNVAYGYNDYSTQRVTGLGTAAADFHGHLAALYAEGGRDFCFHGAELQPFVGLRYVQLHSSAFSETGAGAANLTVGSVDQGSLQCVLGIRSGWTLYTRHDWTVRPLVHASWVHEFLETQVTVDVGPPVPAAVSGLDLGRDRAILGTGLVLARSRGVRLYVNYDLQVNSRQTFHIGSGGLEYEW